VHRIDKRSGGWRLQTSRGDVDARQVVVATGYEHTPVIPDWPEKDGFIGELLHSAHYRKPTSCCGSPIARPHRANVTAAAVVVELVALGWSQDRRALTLRSLSRA
jgi:hypothetical protein